ncbi:MAG: Crp/Fnr family transcriptional regulator [Pseudomonadota bacterium]
MPGAHEVISRKLGAHSRLDNEDIAALGGLTFTLRRLGPNEEFARQGDKPTVSALVLEGWVARYHTLPGGKRHYLSFHMTGDMPDAQTLFIERMDHAVCALGEAEVACIPHEEILRMFEKRPSVGIAIWRETLLDAAIFREAITSNGSRTVLARMAHLFCELYYRARVAGLTRPGSFRIPIHQGQIGDALGMSIVTVNRTLQALRRTDAMEFRNGMLTVRDWKRLTEIAGFDPAYLHLKRPSRL